MFGSLNIGECADDRIPPLAILEDIGVHRTPGSKALRSYPSRTREADSSRSRIQFT